MQVRAYSLLDPYTIHSPIITQHTRRQDDLWNSMKPKRVYLGRIWNEYCLLAASLGERPYNYSHASAITQLGFMPR
jgi:hypothetical protein